MLKLSKTYKDKINYYYSFKTQLESWPRAKLGSLVKARIMSQVDSSQYKNKNDHYHSFKTWFESRPEASPASRAGLIVNSGQCKDKNDYYHSFKTRLEGQLRQGLGHGSGKSTRIDLS